MFAWRQTVAVSLDRYHEIDVNWKEADFKNKEENQSGAS
jgi:hypothetical protein